MEMKICIDCKEEKFITEYYKKRKLNFSSYCKLCHNKRSNIWASKNPEKIKEISKLWNINNKEQRREISKNYRLNNLEKVKEARKNYIKQNKKKKQQWNKNWELKNPLKVKAHKKRMYDKYKYKWYAWTAKRRATLLKATPSWVDLKAIENIYKEREKLQKETGLIYHVDHIIPLQGKNICGLHVPWNLRIIPAKENLMKHNKFNG